MRLLGDRKEGREESANRLSIPFPLHSTLSHLLNLPGGTPLAGSLLVAGLTAVCSPCSRFRLLLRSGQWSVKPKGARWRCEKSAKTKGMVQKRVTAQGWLRSTPEGQRPQIRGLRAGDSLAVASSIPATQLSSPARLAERVVTPHAPMTLGANHVSRAPDRGDPAASGDLRLGHRAPGRGGRRASIPLHALTTLLSALGAFGLFEPRVARICPGNLRYICSDDGNASQGADNTSVRAQGVFCLWEFRVFSTNLNILRSICSGHGDPARRAAATAAPDGSPR